MSTNRAGGLRRRGLGVALLCMSLLIMAAACGQAASSPKPAASPPSTTTSAQSSKGCNGLSHVTVLWVATSALQSLPWIAQDAGYFAQNCVAAKLVYSAGSPTAAAALVSGKVQFGEFAAPAMIAADAKGAHEVMLMNFDDVFPADLVTVKRIQTPQELRGATLGVSKIGANDDFELRQALKHWGLNPVRDVHILAVGSVSAQLAALKRGEVQGTVLNPPNQVIAEQFGAHVLAPLSQLGIHYQGNGLVTTTNYVDSHPHVVAAVVRAIVEADARFKTDPAFSEQVIGKYLKITNPATRKAGYEGVVQIFPKNPRVSTQSMAAVVKDLVSAGRLKKAVPVSRLIDDSFVDALVKSGFVSRLYHSS